MMPFTFLSIISTVVLITVISWATNTVFSAVYKAPTNLESVYISALILVLVIAPIKSTNDIFFVMWAAILMVASKYILAIKRKHIFNPVALAIALTSFGLLRSANWWVGTALLTPLVVVGGYLIVRKIRREDMVFSFCVTVLLTIFAFTVFNHGNLFSVLNKVLLNSSFFFLALVMLTEPLTTPPTQYAQIVYGALVGFLFVPQVHFGPIYSTPELALLIGNIFSYLMSPKDKLILFLQQKIQLTPDTYDFVFQPQKKLSFTPGQYMEWTLPHQQIDSRGNRRYFTIASAPTEDTVRIGVKFYDNSSSYKKSLLKIDSGTPIVAAQLSGDFTLPPLQTKTVLVAGGIGITPFRSMLQYLLDKGEKRDLVVLYSNKNEKEIVYRDVLDRAEKELGIKVYYTVTDTTSASPGWKGMVGRFNPQSIQKAVSDYKERTFYISGPHTMVSGCESVLKEMGVSRNKIKVDYFPGFV